MRLDICSAQVSPDTSDLEKTIIAGAVGTTRARICMFMYNSIGVHFRNVYMYIYTMLKYLKIQLDTHLKIILLIC